jgi:30S ribosomal protein S31
MGKGDRRTKRGKIFRGSFGKRRPKHTKGPKKAKEAPAS